MIFCVDIREFETGTTIKTVLETELHDEAWEVVNQYDKEYGEYSRLLKEYPKEKYFLDVYNDDVR